MNKSIEGRNSKEISIQLKRAEIKKKILTKNIYKEYEIYFQIVRKIILTSTEKGIFGIYSELSIFDNGFNLSEFKKFLNKNISFLIHSEIPLITIEQLKVRNISEPDKEFIISNALKELIELKGYQKVNFDYDNDPKTIETLEFYSNSYSNIYDYY